MLAKIISETIHGETGLGADSVEWVCFSNFQEVLDWVRASDEDGYHVIASESDEQHFNSGESITLLESNATVAYLNGIRAYQRDVVTVEFFSVDLPLASCYFSGDSGSIVAFDNGVHINTVWGDGMWQDDTIQIDRENCHAALEELVAIHEKLDDPVSVTGLSQAIGYAFNCVCDDVIERVNDQDECGNVNRLVAINEYVGGLRNERFNTNTNA